MHSDKSGQDLDWKDKARFEATDAGWRVGAKQLTKLIKEPLVGLLTRHLGPNDEALRGRIATFLDTEIGTAMLQGLLSLGVSALPSKGVPQFMLNRMSAELRVGAMATGGDVLADLLMEPLRQVMTVYLQDAGEMPGALGSPTARALPEAASNGAAQISAPVPEQACVPKK